MKQAFTIMQIGNTELDLFYDNVIAPTIIKCGLEPKRVDKHNEGDLLKNEIVNFIKSSYIVIADLTNERPNCYLEVGYTMGLNKLPNLILTAREDHHQDSLNFKKDGPKIHFDLSGYDILLWYPDNLDDFKIKLEKQINRRLTVISSNNTTLPSSHYAEWISEHSEKLINDVLKLWFDNKHELRMADRGLSIQTPLHKANYKPFNGSKIDNYARIYILDENKRKQIYEHFTDEYKDVWRFWQKLEALSDSYLAKNIEILTRIEEELGENIPNEVYSLQKNTICPFYNLSNTVEEIYHCAKTLASHGEYKNPFKKYPEKDGFKVSSSNKIFAETIYEDSIDKFTNVVIKIIKDQKLIDQLRTLENDRNEINESTKYFKQQLKDIVDDFEDGHTNLKGTCWRCKEWVEQLRSFNKGKI